MKETKNECVGCPKELGCLGSSCPYVRVTRFYCDRCGSEETLYEFEGEELCMDCIQNILEDRVVEGSDI